MTTITKERIELFIKNPLENGLTRGEQMELVRIALASLEAEPVAYIFKHPAGKLFWALTDESNKEQPDVIPVYADSPAPVVPDEIDVNDVPRAVTYFKTHRDCYADGWNACRAAMLQSGNFRENKNSSTNNFREIAETSTNYPVIPDGWISCSDRMPNDAQWCVVNTEYGYYVQCWSEGQGWLGDDISIPKCDVINWMPLPEPPQG
ncbi:DUF551 domain-containing protein [Escherichia coli]|nr:DUF551 domain-containing protein [Escherichia coli]